VSEEKIQMASSLNNPINQNANLNEPQESIVNRENNGEIDNNSTAQAGQGSSSGINVTAAFPGFGRAGNGQGKAGNFGVDISQVVFGQGNNGDDTDEVRRIGLEKLMEGLGKKGVAPVTYRQDNETGSVIKNGVMMTKEFINMMAQRVKADNQQDLLDNSGENSSQFFTNHLGNQAGVGVNNEAVMHGNNNSTSGAQNGSLVGGNMGAGFGGYNEPKTNINNVAGFGANNGPGLGANNGLGAAGNSGPAAGGNYSFGLDANYGFRFGGNYVSGINGNYNALVDNAAGDHNLAGYYDRQLERNRLLMKENRGNINVRNETNGLYNNGGIDNSLGNKARHGLDRRQAQCRAYWRCGQRGEIEGVVQRAKTRHTEV
jgi:hypothetical protein